MFLKKNIEKLRSIFRSAAIAGVTAGALFWGANAPLVNAQTGSEAEAPRGGAANKYLDFTGNGTTDWTTVSLAPEGTGGPITWRVAGNPASPVPNQAFIRQFAYGSADDDVIVVGDYIGDGKADLAVFRTTTASAPGYWYISQFPNGTGGVTLDRAVRWGNGFTDNVVTGDYDGDGKADYAAVRNINNVLNWYILLSGSGTMRTIRFGSTAGLPIPNGAAIFGGADFNGDGRDEIIYVTRNEDGTVVNYFIGDALTGAGLITRSYGTWNTDYSITPADYTGDGKADLVVSRQSAEDGVAVWYIFDLAAGTVTGTRFGIADPSFLDNDLPVRGDYDGDNRHDIAVWRPSNQTFYYISSRFNNFQSQKWGEPGDLPLGIFGQY